MNVFLFLSCFIALQIGCCLVSRARACKNSSAGSNFGEDYFLSGRNLKFFPLTMTFVATQLGGGLLLGAADAAFQYGSSALLYPLGISVGFIILGCSPGKKLASSGMSTIPQIFKEVYGSPFLKRIASLLSISSLFMILTAQIVASDKFFSGLGLSGKWFLFLFWIVVLGYTTLGGFRAVVRTDILQAIFLIAAVIFCIGAVIVKNDFGVANVPVLSSSGIPYGKLWGWLFMPLIFMFIEQDMGQRCFAAVSPEVLKKSAITAGIITMSFSCFPILIGLVASQTAIFVSPGQSVLMIAVGALTNPAVAGVMACAVAVAIMSTADSLLSSVCSLINEEFIRETSSSKKIWLIITPFIAVAAVLTAYCFDDIVEVLILSYGLSVTALGVPILAALFFPKKYSSASAFGGVIVGGITFIALKLFPCTYLPSEVTALLFSLFGFIVFGFFSGKRMLSDAR
ncbi:MAG: sodium:solute symporter family protein [Victivallaceae bacterium]